MARCKGTPKTGGRRPATPNKVSLDLAIACRQYTLGAVSVIVGIMQDEALPADVRLRAARELLDRGHGRPTLDVNLQAVQTGTLLIEAVIVDARPALPGEMAVLPAELPALSGERVALPGELVALPGEPVDVLPSQDPAALPAPQSFYRPKRRCLS